MNPLSVYPPLPGDGAITLRRGIVAYLEHLSLQVETDQFSRDRFLNLQRNLSRFDQAWSVVLRDGRHVLVPIAEAEVTMRPDGQRQRRRALQYSAGDAEEALVVAKKIAAAMKTPALLSVGGGQELVRRNGERPLAECSSDDFARWLLVNPQWKSNYSKRDGLDVIVSCFHWYEEEYKVPNPYRRKRLPKLIMKPRRDAELREYVALMSHRSSKRLRRALWCLYNVNGIRPGSMRELTWSDFNWDAGIILKWKHKTAKATGKPLLIALTGRQLRFFRNLHRQRPPWPDNVFLNTDGQAWTKDTFGRHLRRTAKRIGLDEGASERVSAYCFRHSVATEADEGGVARADIATLLSTGERMVRDVYSHASSKVRHHRRAAEQMETMRRRVRRAKSKEDKQRREEGEGGRLF